MESLYLEQSNDEIVKCGTLLPIKTKRKCRHRKNKHESASQEEDRDFIKTQCLQNKEDKSLKDDHSIIFSDDSVPMPIISKSTYKSHRKCVRYKKKIKVVYTPVGQYNIQNLVISLDAEVKQKKYNCFVNTRSTKNKHKMQQCTVPKERILPNCFRKSCCSNSFRRGMCKNNDSKKNFKVTTRSPSRQIISKTNYQQRYSATKRSESNYSDFMYDDISHGSFESDDEIDVLIKRTKQREREKAVALRITNTTKLLHSSSQYSLSDLSDALSESGHSMEGKTASIHSQVTMVVGEAIYTPTQFSPLIDKDFIDYEPTEYEEDMSLDTVFSVPSTLQQFNGYSEIDSDNNIQFLSEFHKTSKDQTNSNGNKLKMDIPIIKSEVLEMHDNDVIDTALLCLPQNFKTENLGVINDLYVIKS